MEIQDGRHVAIFRTSSPEPKGQLTRKFLENMEVTCSNYSPEIKKNNKKAPPQGSLVWYSDEQYRVILALLFWLRYNGFSPETILKCYLVMFKFSTRVLQNVLSLGSKYFSATFYQTYFYYKPSKYSPFTETHFSNLFTQSRKADK